MRIAYVSDLHCDFDYANVFHKHFLENTNKADVLILAGDTCEIRNLNKPSYFDGISIKKFFKTISKNYNDIIFLYGNHEFYHNEYNNTKTNLRKFIIENELTNITILDNNTIEINDGDNNIVFIGSTLWTDMDNFNPTSIHAMYYIMNDYKYIQYQDQDDICNLKTEHTLGFHLKSVDFITKELQKNKDKKCVVITHHAPLNTLEILGEDRIDYSGGYGSDLSDIILENDNLEIIVYGHTHHKVKYELENTLILSNPRGYPNNSKEYKEFKPQIIEI